MRSLATDPFFIALMTGGNAHIISQPPRPRPEPTTTRRAWQTGTRADIDWEKTLPPSSGDYRNPLDKDTTAEALEEIQRENYGDMITPQRPRACSQQFIDLYTDGAGHCFSDADEGL
ncbi:MAG: hypothetical protein WCP12_09090 [bacterium]